MKIAELNSYAVTTAINEPRPLLFPLVIDLPKDAPDSIASVVAIALKKTE